MKKIFFLRSELLPDNISVYEELIASFGAKVFVFYYSSINHISLDLKSNTLNLVGYKKEQYVKEDILHIILNEKPDLIYINTGHNDKDYLWIAKQVRQKLVDIPVVSGCDTQWRSTLRQRIGRLISRWYLHRYFTHICVAGVYQYEYARMMKFPKDSILFNGISGNVPLFSSSKLESKNQKYPHNFLFVGRFVPVKGLEYLIEAWKKLENKKDWKLVLVGEGFLPKSFYGREDIVIKPVQTQEQLVREAEQSGCFVLPSIFEQWSLVIHEFAAAGLPMICSKACGAVAHFLINKYNGYIVDPANVESLAETMQLIINMPDSELYEMGVRSREMSQSITPRKTAASIYSIIR